MTQVAQQWYSSTEELFIARKQSEPWPYGTIEGVEFSLFSSKTRQNNHENKEINITPGY